MNFLPIWNRKAVSSAARRRLRQSSSELAIELAEPRLLLSATVGTAAITTAQAGNIVTSLHDNLAHLGEVLGGIEQAAADFQHTLPTVSGLLPGSSATLATLTDAASSTHAHLFDLNTMFQQDVVALIGSASVGTATTLDAITTALQNALSADIAGITGNHNVGVTVSDANSTSHFIHDTADTGNPGSLTLEVVDLARFDFTLTMPGLSTTFALDFKGLETSGLSLSAIKGTFNVTEGLTFETQYDLTGTSHAFTLNSAVATTNFNATASIPVDFKIGFGLLSVESTNTVNPISLNYSGTIAATLTPGLADTVLATDAADGTFAYANPITGAHPAPAVATLVDTQNAFALTIPLDLSSDLLQIPGFTHITGSIAATGGLFADNWTFGFNGFDSVKSLADMSPNDLLNVFTNVDNYINQLSQSSLLSIEFPLTNGATIGSVINFATEFQTDIVDKLGSVDDAIGIIHTLQSATAQAGGTATVSLDPTAASLAKLPESFQIELNVDGTVVNLDITNPFTDVLHGNVITHIATLDNLTQAIDNVLPAALLAAGLNNDAVSVNESGGTLNFVAKATNLSTDNPATHPSASISVHTPGNSFVSLVTFAENVASLLGYGDVVSSALSAQNSLQSLFTGIGLHFIPGVGGAAGTLEFQLDYSKHLPAGLSVLGFDGSHRTATDNVTVTASLPTTDFTSAFAFDLVINGHAVEVDVAADPTRTDMVTAINAVLNNTTVNRTDIGLADGAPVVLGSLIQVSDTTVNSHTVLAFTVIGNLTPAHTTTTPLLALSDVNALSFNVGFDLGDLGGLALTNSNFSFDATAGASMTVGIKIPSSTGASAVTESTPLDQLPIWPSGAATADQINNPAMVVRADLGLGDDTGIGGTGLLATDVEALSDFVVASVTGSTLTLTVNGIAPVSGQPATVSVQDGGATGSQHGLTDLGFSIGQSGTGSGNQSIVLTAGTAVTDPTQEFVFNIVINGHAVKIDVPGGSPGRTVGQLVTAINEALAPHTGTPDMTVFLRDGTFGTIEFQSNKANGVVEHLVVVKPDGSTDTITHDPNDVLNPTKITVSDLEQALRDIVGANVPGVNGVSFDTASQTFTILDNGHYSVGTVPVIGATPETLGFAANQSAIAQKLPPANANVDPSTLEYQAVLTANQSVLARVNPNVVNPTADYSDDNAFMLTIGTLDPKLINVLIGSHPHTADGYRDAINEALGLVSYTRAELGLSGPGNVLLSNLVKATDSGGLLTLTLTMSDATNVLVSGINGVLAPEISVNSNNSLLRTEARFGLTIGEVDLQVWGTNGSHLASTLGIASVDKNGLYDNTVKLRPATTSGEIDSTPLQGGTLAERIFIENASLYAGIHLEISGTLSGSLGFLGFSADADGNVYLSTSLSLQKPTGESTVTFQEISDAFTSGTVADLWSFNIGSGKANTPWADLTISNVTINGAGAISGLGAVSTGASIDIKFDGDLSSLGDLLNMRPVVTYTGFSAPDLQNLSFTQIVSGIQTALQLLDNTTGTGVLTANIPLINVNLESILHFADGFANFVTELQNQPAAAVDQVSQAIQQALGTTAVKLALVTATNGEQDLMLNFDASLLNVSTTVPLTLDLANLASAAGITDLPQGIADLASASGTLALTAGATIGISIGIRVSGGYATTDTPLANLNKNAGVSGNGTTAADLQFLLGNGTSFSVDIDGAVTVGDLIGKINTAANTAGLPHDSFASLSASGGLVFTDPSTVTTSVSTSLSALGFEAAHRAATAAGNSLVIDGGAVPSDANAEYAFKLLINGQSVTVDVPAATRVQPGATSDEMAHAMADAINAALSQITVDRFSLDLNGSGLVTLNHLVTAAVSGSDHITLTAAIPDIASTAGPTSLAIQDINPAGLSSLGPTHFTGQASGTNGVDLALSVPLPSTFDPTQAYNFNVEINGTSTPITIGAETNRTFASLVTEINNALAAKSVHRVDVNLAGAGDVALGSLITVTSALSSGAETLIFTAASSATHLAAVTGSPSLDLTQVTFTGHDIASDNGGLSTISTVLPSTTDNPEVYSQAYRFDVVIDGHAVTIDIPESGARASADSLTLAIKAALGSTLIDRSDIGLTGGGQVSVGQLVAVSLSGSTLTFAASDAKLGASHSFALQESAPVPQTLTLKVLDLTNSGLLDQLGIASDTGQAGLTVLGGDPTHFTAHASGTNGVDLALSVALPATFDPTQAYTFSVDINGTSTPISIGADAARTTMGELVTAINDALIAKSVHPADINLHGSSDVTLGSLITVTEASSNGVETLTFTAAGSATSLAPVTGSPSLELTHVTLTDGQDVASNSGGSLTVTMTPAADADFTQAFAVNVVIDGHPITLSIGADAHRTDITAMATAINAALSKLSVDRSEFGMNGTGTTTLDKVLTATATDTQITLTASASDLAPQGKTPSLAVQDIENAATGSGVATRAVTGKGLGVEVDNDRFFIDTSAPVVGTSSTPPSGTGILVSVGVAGTDLNFNTSFGPLSAGIKGGTATLGAASGDVYLTPGNLTSGNLDTNFAITGPATVHLGLAGDSHNQLSFTKIGDAIDGVTSLTSLFAVTTNVAINVDLPTFLIGVSIGDLLVKVGNILNIGNSVTETYVSLPTFGNAFSAFNFLNQPQAVINGLDALLSTTDSLFQAQVFGFKLPLIGDALSSAGDFVGDLRANVIGYLQGLVDDYEALHPGQEPTTASIISDGLSSLLVSLGFTNPTGGLTNLVTSTVDPVAESITFDMNVKKSLFDGSIDLSSNLGIPGLGIDIQNGKIDLGLDLAIDLQFGYLATGLNKGFFFDDTLAGSHALALSISATLPTVNPAAITADLGIVALHATNSTAYNGTTGTQLVGGVYVDLHPKTTADLFDLGFSSTSLGEANGTHVVTAQFAPTLDANDAIIFNINVNGTTFTVSTGVTTSHSLADIETAIQTAMQGIDVAADLVGSNGAEKLSALITVGHSGNLLTFTGNGFGTNDHFTVSDVHLSTSDVPKSLRVDLTASANLDLALSADIPLGGSIELPSVSTELVFEYQYAHLFTGFDDGTFTSGVKVPITFEHVSLDVGHFLTDFLKPILDIAWDILGPIMPVLDFITSPLPGISDLIGSPTSLIQLAQLLGGDNPEVRSIIAAVQMIDEVATLIQTIEGMISSPGGTLKIDFGTYVFGSGSSSDPTVHFLGGATVDPLSAGGSIKNTHISSSLSSVGGTQSGANAAASKALGELGALSQTTQGNGVLSLPILQNPVSALKLLTGQLDGIDLITWELPVFTVGLSAGETFPVVGIPGIGVSAGLNIDFSVSLHVKFGYDTTGLVEFLHSDNPIFLLDGFYVDDTVGPQLTAHFGIAATASLDLVLAKAGITGEIDGDFSFTLLDPNDDGRVRPVEILDTLLHDPLHIFVIDGAITASVTAWWWVGIDAGFFTLTLYEGSETLISGTIVSFHYAPEPTPILATLDSSGTLNLDMGPLANQRAHAGDNIDGDENFVVSQADNDGAVTVQYIHNGVTYTQTFSDGSKITAINADVGIGTNSLTLKNIQEPITINGGDGNNTITLSDLNVASPAFKATPGASTINLGNGNNTVIGGSGVDTITVGDGNNNISGASGGDIILAGAGANFVNGGLGDDTITVGGGRNAVIGGAGNNSIKTGGGNNIVFGGGADATTESTLSGMLNADRDKDLAGFNGSLSGLGFDENGVADGSTNAALGNTLRLGAGNNIVFGGATGDLITAGSGNNIVLADVGTVTLVGNAQAQTSVLQSVSTANGSGIIQTGGGNDTVTLGVGVAPNTVTGHQAAAGYGDQIILGGGGDDTLVGTNGTNIILGDFGSVEGPAASNSPSGAPSPQWTITTLTPPNVGGDDTIIGGVGNDVLFGGPGNDTIKAGPGNDIIAGDDAKLVRDTAAIGPTARVISFESLDENAADNSGNVFAKIAGNDLILDGSTGNDLIIAGGGSDGGDGTVVGQGVFGGSGNNVILGDFGIITSTIETTGGQAPVPVLVNGLPVIVGDVVLGRSTGPDINGANANGKDTISATNGYNVIMGGGDNDKITAGDGTNVIFGDSGSVTRTLDTHGNPILVSAQAVDEIYGGVDQISSGRGSNVVMGGAGSDQLTAGGGDNVLLGDFGSYHAPDGSTPDVVGDTGISFAGDDIITVTGGTTVAMGGDGNDTINANAPEALNNLLGAASRDGQSDTHGGLAVTATSAVSDLTTRYTFDVVLNGYELTVDVGNDTGRTSLDDLVKAITTVFDKTTLQDSAVGLGGGGSHNLSYFLTVSTDITDTYLIFTANQAKLTPVVPVLGEPAFALRDAPSVNTLFGDNGSVTRSSTLALISAETPTGLTQLGEDAASKGGNDILHLNYGQNVAFGGAGADNVNINGSGVNVVLGDNGIVTAAVGLTPDIVLARNTALNTNAVDTITITANATSNNIVLGGDGGDIIDIQGKGANVAFGDSGQVERAPGTLAFISAQTDDPTLDESVGGDDHIIVETAATGNNVLIGGAGQDIIDIFAQDLVHIDGAKNVALGDVGSVVAATSSGDPDTVTAHMTANGVDVGDHDVITVQVGATGDNILIGGGGEDTITIDGTGNNTAFGDGGVVTRAAGTLAPIAASSIEGAPGGEDSHGGNDSITVGTTADHNNILIGGAGDDVIKIEGDGKNIALGDLGSVTAAVVAPNTPIAPDTVLAIDTYDGNGVLVGGVDKISVTVDASGDNIVMGGAYGESLHSLNAAGQFVDGGFTIDGIGNNIVFGDSGEVLRQAVTLTLISALTVDEPIGGNDTIAINGPQNNIALGGAGTDTITIAGIGNNIALGDMGTVNAIDGINPDVVGRDTDASFGGAADILKITSDATGNNIIMGETGDETGADAIVSNGSGLNIIFGDTGSVTRTPATQFVPSKLVSVVSVDPSLGGVDTITATDGSNIVFGGAQGDFIQTAGGIDYIVGDNGAFTFLNTFRSELRSTDFAFGGDDTINAGAGENYVIGGTGNDTITGNAGRDVVIGDQGVINWDAAAVGAPLVKMSSLFDVNDTEGVDHIDVGEGDNNVIGGGKGDFITSGAGSDAIIGDNGSISFLNNLRTQMTSADFTIAGNDVITPGDGDNYVIGGGGNDSIVSGSGRDQLIGDQGFVTWNADGTRHEVSSLLDAVGTAGTDDLHGGGGNDNIIGGNNADTLYGDGGNDIVIGDDGRVLFTNDQERMAETLDQHAGTGDIISGGSGNNFLFGGEKNNFFFANPLADLIVIMDGHIDISAGRTVAINIPPFFGDPLLSPLGKSLQNAAPGDPGLVPLQFTVIQTGADAGGLTAVFGAGQDDGSSLIISTLSGEAKSSFDIQGLLSGNVTGASLLNLLEIGPTSLIESVTVGDLDSQQDGSPAGSQTAAIDHSAVEGVLAQVGLDDQVPDAPAPYRPVLVEAMPSDAGYGFAASVEPAAAMVFDEERGVWIADVAAGAGPQLILNGADLPMLDLSGEMTMAA